ncbi:MAG TPA: sodium-translocating pyrophosphatase [Mariprofundaceae bacterium]|nr:sodium-translocating pyrophosphatase [Mariprofundaceae bacterium]
MSSRPQRFGGLHISKEQSLVLESIFGMAAALAGIAYALWCASWVMKQPEGEAALRIPYLAIREGAHAFMRTQYSVIGSVAVAIFVILWITPAFGWLTATGFAVGALCSAASGAIGMAISVRANVRTAAAAEHGLPKALQVSQRSGSVTGFLVGGLALAAVSGFYLLLWRLKGPGTMSLQPMTGLGFGASLISIFGRLGGGIFTKAADVGADLSGKIEHGIPEDDPRNPAVIADNVGDNVGDCAGMAADVFESYAVTVVAAMLVAAWSNPGDMAAQQLPLALGSIAMIAGIIGMQTVRLGQNGSLAGALSRGLIVSIVLAAIGYYFACQWVMGDSLHHGSLRLFGASLVGLAVGLGMVLATNYFTGTRYGPVQRIARASCSGHATNIITGLAISMESTAVPALCIAAGIIAAHALAGVYGIAIATCALLALTPTVISIDAYGPITDNAGGIVEMAGLPDNIREITDALDTVGNTTKALTKVFAIGSAGLAALTLFVAYKLELGGGGIHLDFTLGSPYVLAGLFIGALMPFLFGGFAMDAVGHVAARIVEEVRRQFEANPEILAGRQLPDYDRAVSMLTRTSIRSMLLPASLPVAVPLLIAFVWAPFAPSGSAALLMGGVVIGAVSTGLILALSMCTGGGAWDNAKKYIEAGHYGGKTSSAHAAAVTGDTVGDPYKDTAGPAINPMCKVLSLMAVLLAPFLI